MKTIFFAFAFLAIANCAFSRGIPDYLKRNWIAIIRNSADSNSFDSLQLVLDNERIDTARLYYIYCRYQRRRKFATAHFNKEGNVFPCLFVEFEKWKVKKVGGIYILSRRKLKSKSAVRYILNPYFNERREVYKIVLTKYTEVR